MTWIKKAVWLLVAAFVLFYLFTRAPNRLPPR